MLLPPLKNERWFLCCLMTAVFITPLPSEREFKGCQVQCDEKVEDWSEERSNYSKLKHSFLIKKKCLDTEKYCKEKGTVEY